MLRVKDGKIKRRQYFDVTENACGAHVFEVLFRYFFRLVHHLSSRTKGDYIHQD
jgi:hypothetical protein